MSAEPSHSNNVLYVLMAVTLLADIVGCSMRYQPPASTDLNYINQLTDADLQAATVEDAVVDTEFCPTSTNAIEH
jgi:hypothetical protein